MIQTVAIGWLMTQISTSDVMVALVQATSTLPAFILSVVAGVVADNFSRRMVMIIGRSLVVAGSAALSAFIAFGFVDPWIILGVSFLIGCGFALNDPAWQASVGDLVDRHNLPGAITLINIGFNTVRSVGPAVGGFIVAALGAPFALVLSTISYMVPLAAVLRTRWTVRASPLPRQPVAAAIYDGARFTFISSEIIAAVTRGTLFGIAGIAILALLPLIVRDHLHGGAIIYGMLMGGFGLGAFLGGITANRIRQLVSLEWLIRLSCIVCAACSLTLAFSPSLPLSIAALALGGVGWVNAWSGLGVSVQLASPRWIVGRTVSIYYAFTYGGIALGSWTWGIVVQNYSLGLAFQMAAGSLLLVSCVGLVLPLNEDKASDHDPIDDFQVPTLALGLGPKSGPIVAKIDYIVPTDNAKSFVNIMRERRLALSQVGARQWTVERDLLEPARWTETFRTPTWTDYLRLNSRLTAAHRDLDRRLRELHLGGEPPKVRLSIEQPRRGMREPEGVHPLLT